MDLTPNVILSTTDYTGFKYLVGNREVNPPDVECIIDSIRRGFDYTIFVIDINEKGEIWDGQHRFTALKALGLPVRYKVTIGAGIDDCISANANQRSWSAKDFISSFANRGHKDYITLLELVSTYDCLPLKTILRIVGRKMLGKKFNLTRYSKAVKQGGFKLDDAVLVECIEEFDFLKAFDLVRKKNKQGATDTFYNALSLCYECPQVNNGRLYQRMSENTDKFGSFNTLEECLDRIQAVYNLYSRNKMYVVSEVNRMLTEKKKGA